MADFTFVNDQGPSYYGIYGPLKLCLCCLAKDVPFVNLLSCGHYSILEKLCSVKIPKLELDCLVCYYCHAKLKTIYDFKLQAEESFTKLWSRFIQSRQFTLSKRAPKLEEVQIVSEGFNLVYQPEELTVETSVKPEQHYVADHQEVMSGCWASVLHRTPDSLAQSDDKKEVPWSKNRKDDDKFSEIHEQSGGTGSTRARYSNTQTEVTNYPVEAAGLYPDSPNVYEVMLEQDAAPLVKIERIDEIEAPALSVEAAGSGRKRIACKKSYRKKAEVNNLRYCSKCDMTFSTKRNQIQHNLIMHRKNKQPKETKKKVSSVGPEVKRPPRSAKRFTEENCAEMAKWIKLTHEDLMLEREKKRMSETYMQKAHKCDSCIIYFTREHSLKEHNEKYHQLKKNSFQCGICNVVLSSMNSLSNHEGRHYKRFDCVVCQKRYNSLRVLIDHFTTLHEPKNKITYTCDQCDFTTTTDRSYKYHKEKFHQTEKFLCLICNINFTAKASLKSHLLYVHNNEKREMFPCGECNKTYVSEKYLQHHIKTVHNPPSVSDDSPAAAATEITDFFCDTCNKYFKGKTMKYHLKNHKNHRRDEDKRFICDICNARYFIKSQLQYHIIWKHLQLRSFTCPECNKGFETNNNLNKHINYVHKKIRPPRDKICDYCGKGYQTNVALQTHIRSHTGERPFQCENCPATFAHSGAYYTHKKLVHTQPRKRKLL